MNGPDLFSRTRIRFRLPSGMAMRLLLSIALSLLAMGCDRSSTQGTATRSAVRPATTAQPFRIVATDHGFRAPAQLSAGLRHMVFENQGSQVHEAMLVKLPPGMGADDYIAAVKGGAMFPEGALDYSGPGLTAPGESIEVWMRVDPGRYVLICWNGDHPTTVPVHAFVVVDDGAVDEVPPVADAVLRQVDFRFELVGTLHKGPQVIRIETPGPSMHEMDLFRLRGDHTAAELNHWRKREDAGLAPDSKPPADAMGGVLDSHDIHRVTWLRRRFDPGNYVFFCEMPMPGDAGSTLTHADVGMSLEIKIAQ